MSDKPGSSERRGFKNELFSSKTLLRLCGVGAIVACGLAVNELRVLFSKGIAYDHITPQVRQIASAYLNKRADKNEDGIVRGTEARRLVQELGIRLEVASNTPQCQLWACSNASPRVFYANNGQEAIIGLPAYNPDTLIDRF